MYCIRCGNQLQDGTRYCIYCGTPTAAMKKERPRPSEDMDSIPIDFFSSRMIPDDQDDFTISLADDFTRPDTMAAFETPDEAGDLDFTRMVTKEDIRKAMAEQTAEPEEIPDEAGDLDFTRVVAKENIRAAMAEQTAESEEIPDEAGDLDFTRMVAKENIRAAMAEQTAEPKDMPEIDIQAIPDIPIPSDFIVQQDVEFEENESMDEEDDEPEPLMSGRGVAFVVLVVVLLFAIAVGAFITAVRGTDASGADGSASEISFWSAGEE